MVDKSKKVLIFDLDSKVFLSQPKKFFLGQILREILSKLRIKRDVIKKERVIEVEESFV
jgi:hypothetical protein